MATTTIYLTRDEYVDQRAIQDRQINVALDEIRTSVTRLEEVVNVLKEDVRVLKEDVRVLKEDMKEVKIELKQSMARFRNQLLRTPTQRISPIAIQDPIRGILEPDSSLFPRNAKEFYALRHPTTDKRKKMLQYLVGFYDISLDGGNDDDDDDDDYRSDSSEASNDERSVTESLASRAVHLLEGILGLVEDNFLSFMERAQERRQRGSPVGWSGSGGAGRAPKRMQNLPPADEPVAFRPRISLDELIRGFEREDNKQTQPKVSPHGISFVEVGWREAPSTHPDSKKSKHSNPSKHSKPSSVLSQPAGEEQQEQQDQPQAERLAQAPRGPASLPHRSAPVRHDESAGDSGSPTNAFTSSPGSSRLR